MMWYVWIGFLILISLFSFSHLIYNQYKIHIFLDDLRKKQDEYQKIISNLIASTDSNQIKWNKELFGYVTIYNKQKLQISGKYRLELEILDDKNRSIWKFPQCVNLNPLYNSIIRSQGISEKLQILQLPPE